MRIFYLIINAITKCLISVFICISCNSNELEKEPSLISKTDSLSSDNKHSLETTPPKKEPFFTPHKTTLYTMDSIIELATLVKYIRNRNPREEIVIVYDWDNTISLENGSCSPLREGDLTSRIIHELFKTYFAQFFILTSRFEGEPAQVIMSSAIANTHLMHNALPILKETSIMNDPCYQYGFFPIENSDREAFFCKGVLFAGAKEGTYPVKGKVLRQLADGQEFYISKAKNPGYQRKLMINFQFDHLIFVDNLIHNIRSAEAAFSDYTGRGKLHFIHYEQKINPVVPLSEVPFSNITSLNQDQEKTKETKKNDPEPKFPTNVLTLYNMYKHIEDLNEYLLCLFRYVENDI